MASQRVPTFCALCVSRCGAVATVEDGAFVALEPDPTHPTGQALCIKGKVAPELVAHPDRLLHPLKRTRPKGDPDPGWQRISWDEALATTSARLRELASESGPESVAFTSASPSTSAMSDSLDWLDRLRRAFGTPNMCGAVELCAWGRYFASSFTFGAPVPGLYMPDLDRAGCVLFWGYNPSVSRICHATAAAAALKRGARMVVVDPRRVGLAHRADEWLRVRPGTDAALALAIAGVMLERGWFDEPFVRRWTNAPLLVRADSGRLVRESDLSASGSEARYVAWNHDRDAPAIYDPATGAYDCSPEGLRLFGEATVETPGGPIASRPALQVAADSCVGAQDAERITGVSAGSIERAARLLWESRPVAMYFWSGIEQHTNTSQIARAIGQIYALTGSLDAPGGNVAFPSVPANRVMGIELLPADQRARALGLEDRPIGPGRWQFVTSDELYTAALEGLPYRVRGLVGFGANLLLANADSERGRRALANLDFYVHADLFMTPTSEMADVVLPVASPFETEALRIGFEVSAEAQSLVQLRRPVAAPRGEARSDIRIIFDLATRLGLGEHFWDGDIDAAYRHQLAPSGVSLEELRARPGGVRVPLETRHRKFAEDDDAGPRGFATPSKKIELYSERLLCHGYPPVPEFEEPAMSPRARPDLAERYPLVLTCAKSSWYCETQHRQLASLRRRAPDPRVELHPETAASRGIEDGDWVRIETPTASVRARARLVDSIDPGVVCGQHGWWQACDELDAPGYDPFAADGANLNLAIRHKPADPMSGTVPHRSYLCEVTRISRPT